MTPDEQRIAIAEACPTIFRHDGRVVYYRFDHQRAGDVVDPLNDLNAMHEAENAMSDDQREQFAYELLGLLGIDCDEPCTPLEIALAVSATAAQHAEAMCRTLWPERWKNTP